MNRLSARHVADLMDVTGVSDIGRGDDPWPAIQFVSRMSYGLSAHDNALIYAEVVRHLEANGIHLGPELEYYFFDRMTQEVTLGQESEGEGREVREANRTVAIEGIGPRRASSDERDAARERGGREGAGRVELDLGDPGEASSGTESLERPGGSGGFSDLPF